MLLEYGGYNFNSFKEGFDVNLRLDANCPKKISRGKEYTNLLAVKGANASGKTNILRALSFMMHFATSSFSYSPKQSIPIDSYFGNKEKTELYIVFSIENKEYTYELVLTSDKVHEEKISVNNKPLVHRKENILKIPAKEYSELRAIKLRDNASFISTAYQYELDSINKFYHFFENSFSNVFYNGLNDKNVTVEKASRLYYNNPEVLNAVIELLKEADTGIDSITIKEDTKENGTTKEYQILFEYHVDNEKKYLSYEMQSSGVKLLYRYLYVYIIHFVHGGVLIMDEIDINLHPDLLNVLIDMFDNKDINKADAQLIFTTHNEDIMDKLKKYRLVFANKENNESYLYRLDETGNLIRNDRSMRPLYDSGKLGGRPKIKRKSTENKHGEI